MEFGGGGLEEITTKMDSVSFKMSEFTFVIKISFSYFENKVLLRSPPPSSTASFVAHAGRLSKICSRGWNFAANFVSPAFYFKPHSITPAVLTPRPLSLPWYAFDLFYTSVQVSNTTTTTSIADWRKIVHLIIKWWNLVGWCWET